MDFVERTKGKMYEKNTYDEVLAAGSMHLFSKDQHSDPQFSWLEACKISEQGVRRNIKVQWTWVRDNDGFEVQWTWVPSGEKPDDDNWLPWKKGKGQGKGNDWSYDPERRDRSRSRRNKKVEVRRL